MKWGRKAVKGAICSSASCVGRENKCALQDTWRCFFTCQIDFWFLSFSTTLQEAGLRAWGRGRRDL